LVESYEESSQTVIVSNEASDDYKFNPLNVGVLIPTLNEEKNIGHVLHELRTLGYSNLLVIDGKSKDQTIKIAKNNGAKVVLQIGRGKGTAIRQALNGDYLNTNAFVIMDADGSMSPGEIPQFAKALDEGADIAKGSRFVAGGYTYDMSVFRKVGNAFFTVIVNVLHRTKYTDLCYGYVAFSKRAIRIMGPVLESVNFEIETEIFIKAKKLGLAVKEVPSIEYKRKNGDSNLGSFRDGFKILLQIFSELRK